jgi:beta-glucosidase-like glycosyl hydrolase
MIGHATYPQVDGTIPASLSARIGVDLLRNELGFDGLSISDDMEMHAVSDLAPYEEIGTKAILAGSDIVLFCSHIERMPALIRHLELQCANDERFSVRCGEAIRRGEEYRAHCRNIVNRSAAPVSINTIADEADRFYEELRMARFKDKPPLVPAEDRRKLPRDPAKGRTGREEWT